MYGIDDRVYQQLMKYFKSNTDIHWVKLFGSRAKNNHRFNSDIDVCIDYSGMNRSQLVFELEEIVGIYSIDLLYWDSIDGEIKKQIERDGVIIYTKNF